MEIKAQIIQGVEYQPILESFLRETSLADFNINTAKSSCIVSVGQNRFAVSKWVSPKRTRSYPYERVYNTFFSSKRITIIPVIKDEGAAGDRDFLQWDTISLMSLLDVYVVLAFYDSAEKHRTRVRKITNQKFNNDFVVTKIKEISAYHSSALHWNLKELKNISQVLENARNSYQKISEKTGVLFHSDKGLQNFAVSISENLSNFMESSRLKAQSAQAREFLTIQPKEILQTVSKAKITISNYLGGMYFFTVDEVVLQKDKLFLIESKHTQSGKIPSVGDIKDGLLKMMLYTNLENLTIEDKSFSGLPVLRLTSTKLSGEISSNSEAEMQENFFCINNLSNRQKIFLRNLFVEARTNNFMVSLGKAER